MQGFSPSLLRRDDHGQRVRVVSDSCALDLIVRNSDLNRCRVDAIARRTCRIPDQPGHRNSMGNRREAGDTIIPPNGVVHEARAAREPKTPTGAVRAGRRDLVTARARVDADGCEANRGWIPLGPGCKDDVIETRRLRRFATNDRDLGCGLGDQTEAAVRSREGIRCREKQSDRDQSRVELS